jgi:cytochrome P450
VTDLLATNFFRDSDVQNDPYPYFDAVREAGRVWREPHYGVFMVTGYEEALDVYHAPDTFSSCNTVSGPFKKFPVPFEGDDVNAIIDEYRDELPFSDQLPSFDPPRHTDHRALMMRLLTPGRLRENEEFMWRSVDTLFDTFLADGRCEFIRQFAAPYTLVVVADLEGVPESDHAFFEEKLTQLPGQLEHKPLEFLYAQFSAYIEERRRAPRDDIMTAMATATFPDGTEPTVNDVALLAANLFTGGQETTVRLLSFALRLIAERPDIQKALRDDRDRIPNFIEETLRYESPLRAQFRMARVRTEVAGLDVTAGSTMLLLPGAANRDARKFADPSTFDLARENANLHVAFGHGIHHCAGAHLARAEARVTINRLFDRTTDIRIDESEHGPADDRRWDYLPTYFLRGLRQLHLEFDA